MYFLHQTSTNFRHGNIIRYNNRPFESVQEQTEKLIENWNMTVPDTATVFILGDFAFASKNQWKAILNRLTGKKYLILGNHDVETDIPKEYFEEVCDLCKVSIKIGEQNWKTFILSHRPLLCWEGSETGTLHLHGHCHDSPTRIDTCQNGDIDLLRLLDYRPMLDVGVDNCDYKPINVEKVLERISNKTNGNKSTH